MYIDDEREAFFVDAHRKYHSKMENVCRAYVQYNEEYRSLIDDKAAPQVAETIDNIDTWLQNEDNTNQLQRILDVLSQREAQVYHEYFEDEKSMAEVAETQNTTVSAIKSILARIRKKARAMHNIDYLFFFFIIATFSVLARLM